MKVKVFGFVWEAKGEISIDDFFLRIKASVEDEVKVLSSQTTPYPDEGLRLLAVAKIGTIWGGVIAHFKSRTRFIESEIGEGKIEFSDQKIGVKRKHSEFNFFYPESIKWCGSLSALPFCNSSKHILRILCRQVFRHACDSEEARQTSPLSISQQIRLRFSYQ